MKILLFCAAALVASAPSFAQTTVPATPQLTAGAELKGLRFDWEPVAGATSYQLEYRAHRSGAFVAQGAALQASATSTSLSFPLHLFDWTYARYRLAACNNAGCSRSAEVSVSLLRRDAVGYFKPGKTLIGVGFGADVDLSPDGYNFVAAAPGDFIYDNGTTRAGGALYVFRRGSDGEWLQRARLTPTVPPFIEGSNDMRVGISASGNTIALAMPGYFHEEFDESAGEVQVFHWNGTSWARTRIPRVPSSEFGQWVAISDSGFTLAVGVGGIDTDTTIAMYKLVGGVWQNVRNITATPDRTESCGQGVLSRDGSTLAEHCMQPSTATTAERHYVRVHSGDNWTVRTEVPLELTGAFNTYGYGGSGLAISGNGDTIAAQLYNVNPPAPVSAVNQVNVFKRTGGVYSQVMALTPGAWMNDAYRGAFGAAIAISGDGATIAVGDDSDVGQGTGPRAAPLIAGDDQTGAVYVFRLTDFWKVANMVKPNYAPDGAHLYFGRELALSASGKTLIIGQREERGGDDGIGGDWRNTEDPQSGAVWLY